MKMWIAAIALGATVISTQTSAQERGGPGQGDKTRQQAQQRAEAMFQRFDLNHDNEVTRAEAEQAASSFGDRGQRMIARVFGAAQTLTLQQFEAQALARFDAEDLNHDGTVTSAERQQVRAQRQGQGRSGQ
jgi:EF hand